MSGSRMTGWLVSALAMTAGGALILLPPARAETAAPGPQAVTLQGQAIVGSTLTAVPAAFDPLSLIEYRWQRCDTAKQASCERIKKSGLDPSYTVDAADVGNHLAVRAVAVIAGVDVVAAWSDLTGVVPGPTPTPSPTPTPTPSPTPTPTPSPTPTPTPTPDPGSAPEPELDDRPSTFDQSDGLRSLPAVAKPAIPAASAPSYLRPFPVVRVKGRLATGGARISLLRVRAPRAATVDVRCTGQRCRARRHSRGGARVAALERFLRAGTTIEIRVSGRGHIGKYVRIVIRDGSAPRRRDACLMPGSAKPAACPPA